MAELSSRVVGEVRFDAGSRSTYSTDSSNYRQVPIGVVVPRTIEDVIATVEVCHRRGVPITTRGGGTSLAGQCTNVAVIIDFSKYLNQVCSVDPESRTAIVEPGCNLDHLRSVAAVHGLTFGPDPATHNRNTLGGMIGNNSCGVHSVMAEFYGPGPLTVDQVIELDVVTYDGHRMTVGSLSPDELDAVIAGGGRKGEIHAAIARPAGPPRPRHPHPLPGHPAAGLGIQPRSAPARALRRGQVTGGHRRHLRGRAARHLGLDGSQTRAGAGRARLPRRLFGR